MGETLKKVCLYNWGLEQEFHGYRLETFDPAPYFTSSRWAPWLSLLTRGAVPPSKFAGIASRADLVDQLYRDRDPEYMRMVGDFVERFREHDAIVMSTHNFLHPEILYRELKHPIKVLGFVDDPYSTYTRGIPYLWAFDGAFFISPGYLNEEPFDSALQRWGGKPATWHPLTWRAPRPENVTDAFFRDRGIEISYVGNPYGPKINRLISLKRHFGSRLRVHGRWGLGGYYGLMRGLLGKPIYRHRVTGLTPDERRDLYWKTKIGFNMHLSDRPVETGNLRMYEVPAHGMMMICDKAAGDAHARIFQPGVEAVFYDTIEEAIELIENYLRDEDARLRIARAGFERFWSDYEWENRLLDLLGWCLNSVRKN